MSFGDIKGQDRAVTFLKNAASSGRVSHAYIFLGPSGVGKKLAALNFAKALNCLSEARMRPCDECASCRKADNGNHPDIMLLKPEKGAASFKIEKIRELINQTALKAYEGRRKVYIIDEASSLTREAISALLKTLEEPASDSTLIMLFEDLRYVPRTILSRSQVIRFFPMRFGEIRDYLVKERKLDAAKAELMARVSGGRIGDALGFDDESILSKREKLLAAMARQDIFSVDFDEMSKEELRVSLDTMLSWYGDLLAAKVSAGGEAFLFNADRKDVIRKVSAEMDADAISRAIEDIIKAGSYIDDNANAKLVMGVLGLRIFSAT